MLPTLRKQNSHINPLDGIYDIFDDFAKWTDTFSHFHGLPTVRGIDKPSFVPSLDVVENDDAYVMTLETPGVKKEDIQVSIEENQILVIKGSKTIEETEKGTETHVSERFFGSFRRELRLPKNVAAEKIDLQFKDGVLRATLPKIKEKEPEVKKLEIK